MKEVPARGETAADASSLAARTGLALGGAIQNDSDGALAHEFDLIGSTRTHWVRMDVNWDVIQRAGPSSYNWAPFDRIASAARDRGLSVLATILYTPPWARPAGTDATTPPTSLADYASFARTAVAHFSALGVHAYEIWNEPNIAVFWKPKPDVARYAEMLRAAYAAVKSADPKAFVVTGGLSPAPDDGSNVAPVTFLDGIYAHGGKSSFDAVGHHPYCAPAFPGDAQAWSAWYQMVGAKHSLRTVMADNGDAGKQIWATEFGAPTSGPAGSFVSEQTQAAMLDRAYKLFDSYAWAGPLFWYAPRDEGTNASRRDDFYGLVRNDFSPKPALTAFRAIAANR